MGCEQSAHASNDFENKVAEIPCQPEQIGHYLNDLRQNPVKYADLLQR